MLYKRYANPMELLDGMLDAGNLNGFVGSVIDLHNEDTREKTLWEYWLHKDWQTDWKEFFEARSGKTQAAPTQAESLDIVKESMKIMQSFTLSGGGAEDANIQNPGRDCDRCVTG